ncbi:unnamed protein product, partial [Amoebophrya sp. A25]
HIDVLATGKARGLYTTGRGVSDAEQEKELERNLLEGSNVQFLQDMTTRDTAEAPKIKSRILSCFGHDVNAEKPRENQL